MVLAVGCVVLVRLFSLSPFRFFLVIKTVDSVCFSLVFLCSYSYILSQSAFPTARRSVPYVCVCIPLLYRSKFKDFFDLFRCMRVQLIHKLTVFLSWNFLNFEFLYYCGRVEFSLFFIDWSRFLFGDKICSVFSCVCVRGCHCLTYAVLFSICQTKQNRRRKNTMHTRLRISAWFFHFLIPQKWQMCGWLILHRNKHTLAKVAIR